jgi:hypothetical protein
LDGAPEESAHFTEQGRIAVTNAADKTGGVLDVG